MYIPHTRPYCRFLYIEKKVLGIPGVLPVGPICLQTDPIKDALHGFSMAWKTQFASVLHEEAKVRHLLRIISHTCCCLLGAQFVEKKRLGIPITWD